MQIKKREFVKYVVLNCLTLGIYGFIVSREIGMEINAICKGDGEEPRFGYAGAVLIRGISTFVGIAVGLIAGIIGNNSLQYVYMFGMSEYKAAVVFACMLVGAVVGTIFGSIVSGIYLNYWWYKQANRLKLNGNRYGLVIKESGIDNILFRTVIDILFLPITLVLYTLSLLLPILIVWLILHIESSGAVVFAVILLFVFVLPILLFGSELTAGANFAMYFVFKNLNRYAKVYGNGVAPFDPMGYEYYPSIENKYPNFLPEMINGAAAKAEPKEESGKESGDNSGRTTMLSTGQLIGVKGSCAGYGFELTSGEEIVIGKDAKMSSVVIDPAYKEISRKHVSVCYDMTRDQYRVIDFSSNGTWANGEKLVNGQPVYLPHGTELKLANDKNIFQLG